MFYLLELRDSDGNDCTVYDIIVEAADQDSALDRAWSEIMKDYPDDEEDGGYGTFHPCDCECEHGVNPYQCEQECDGDQWECSHGGLLLNDHNVKSFETYAEALAAHARYHCLIDLTTTKETTR